ncbi:MAG TPA: HAD family phosphatase [Chloroflexota bacterium]|nr:HAD family phosphatase [Chloroflexota bacterium]
MRSRFEAIIFDMDGVLIDSEPLHFEVLNTVLATDGQALSRAENEEFIGTTTAVMWQTLIARRGLGRSMGDYIELYDQTLLRLLLRPHSPQPGVVPLVKRARELGMRLGVASSSKRLWIEATLRSLGLADAFDAIVSGDDVQRGKPDPQIYLLAAEQVGIAPARCLAIEDAPKGVQSARAAGMTVLGVRTPYTAHLHLEGVDRVVDSLADLELSGGALSV